MAAMTPQEIRSRIMTLVEADPPALVRPREAFSLDRQPNTVLDNAYTLETELVSERSMTAGVSARIDRITLTVARTLKQDSETEARALLDVLTDVDRRVRADGINNSYHAWAQSQRVVRPEGRDYCLGVLAWTCDYDFTEALS